MLRASQVIRNLPIFICPGDKEGDTKIRAVFVTTSFRQCTRSTLQNNLRLKPARSLRALTASRYFGRRLPALRVSRSADQQSILYWDDALIGQAKRAIARLCVRSLPISTCPAVWYLISNPALLLQLT